MYTKKFANATSQITLFPKTRRRRSAVVISEEGLCVAAASISSSGTPASVGESLTQKKQKTVAAAASDAGTQKHPGYIRELYTLLYEKIITLGGKVYEE